MLIQIYFAGMHLLEEDVKELSPVLPNWQSPGLVANRPLCFLSFKDGEALSQAVYARIAKDLLQYCKVGKMASKQQHPLKAR